MVIDETELKNKKGVIVIGSARSGSHYTTNALFNLSKIKNKIFLGELYSSWDPYAILSDLNKIKEQFADKFVFASIVSFLPKNLLRNHITEFGDYYLINLRRKDKVSQFVSFYVMKKIWDLGKVNHSPDWKLIKKDFPFTVTEEDIDQFIIEQNCDYTWPVNRVLYYEDIDKLQILTKFKKNSYPFEINEIFSNPEIIVNRLSTFKYYDK